MNDLIKEITRKVIDKLREENLQKIRNGKFIFSQIDSDGKLVNQKEIKISNSFENLISKLEGE